MRNADWQSVIRQVGNLLYENLARALVVLFACCNCRARAKYFSFP